MTLEVKDVDIPLNGMTFHYRDWAGVGWPAVFLHGLASTCRIWDLTAPYLKTDFRVVALDQRGHGESDQPEGSYDIATHRADLREFIAALGLHKPVLVGHSWGGNVALDYAATYPQEVAALVLVDGGYMDLSLEPGMTWERTQEVLAPPDLTGLTLGELLERAKSHDLGPLWSPAIQEVVLSLFHVNSDGTIAPRLRRENHLKIIRALWEQRPSQLGSRVRCPVLVVPAVREPTNQRDATFMDHKRRAVPVLERALARHQTLWMEDTIHDIPLQRPQELAEAIGHFVHSTLGEAAAD